VTTTVVVKSQSKMQSTPRMFQIRIAIDDQTMAKPQTRVVPKPTPEWKLDYAKPNASLEGPLRDGLKKGRKDHL
jgi:hypothetical protein